MEKLQRFSIRKLSIGAVSCLIGTVSFLSYSYKVQAAEAPQTVKTAKAENEIQLEKAQESKPSEEIKGNTQNAVVDKNTNESQETSAVTTVSQASPKKNVPAANETAKANGAAVINKAEANKEANKLNGEGNETGSVDTTVLKTNTVSKESKQNIADLTISTKMKLQAIRLAKPMDVNNAAVMNTLDQSKLEDSSAVSTANNMAADSTPTTPVTNKASHESNSQAQPSSSVDHTQTKLVRRPVMRLAAATATNSDELIVGKDVTISDFSVTAAKGKNEFENGHANIKFTMHADDPSVLAGKRLTIQVDKKVWDGFYTSEQQDSNTATISYQGQVIGTFNYGYPYDFVYITFNDDVKNYTKIDVQSDLVVAGTSQHAIPYRTRLYTLTQAKDGQTYYLTNDVTIGQQKYSSNLPSVIHYYALDSQVVSSATDVTTTSYSQGDSKLYAGTFYKTPNGIYYSKSLIYDGNNLYDSEQGQPGYLSQPPLYVGTDIITDHTQSYTVTSNIDQTKLSPDRDSKLMPITSYSLYKDCWDDKNLLPNTRDVYVYHSWTHSSTATADATVTKNSVIFNKLNGQSLATRIVTIESTSSHSFFFRNTNYVTQTGKLYLTPALFKQLQAVAESDQNLTEAINTVKTTGRDAEIKLANPINTGVKARITTSEGKTKEVSLLIDTIGYRITTASTAPRGSILVSAQGKTAKVYHPGDQNIPAVVDQSQLTKTITRTINVHKPGEKVTTIKQDVVMTQSVSVVDDKDVTYNGDWKVQGDSQWANYDVPSVSGYTASQSHVVQQAVTDTTKDQTIEITYTANDHQISVEYVDNATGQVLKTDHVSGKTGQTVPITPHVPDGWELVSGQSVPSEVTLGADGAPATVIKVQPQERSVAVKFVDDQYLKQQVGQAITLTGRDGDTVKVNVTVPDKYQLADGQQLPTTYTFTAGSGDVTIHLVHKVVQREATIDVQLGLITFVDFGNNSYEPDVLTQARWKQLEEEEAKDGPVMPGGEIPFTEVGTLTGHVGYDLVDEEAVSFGDDWTSLNLGSRTYQLPNGTDVVNGIMIDSNDTMGKKLKEYYLDEYHNWDSNKHVDPDYANRPWQGYLSANATNSTQTPGSWDVIRLGLQAGLAGSESNTLAKATGDRAATSVELVNKTIDLNWLQDHLGFTASDFKEQDGQLQAKTGWTAFGVYIPYIEKTATRTINVTTPDGKTTAVKQTATLAKQVDFGKDAHPAWTTGEWANYDVPTIPGYTASQSNVAKKAVTGTTEDQTVNITYTANPQTATVVYQTEDGTPVHTTTVNGQTGQTVKVSSEVPVGWKVINGNVPSEITFGPDGAPQTVVTIAHQHVTVTSDAPKTTSDKLPDNPSKAYPVGVGENDLNKTVTRTIKVTTPDGQTKTFEQTAKLTRTADVDEVTGEVKYSNWTTDEWTNYVAPSVPGYTASQSNVAKEAITGTTKDQTVNITYTANDGTQTIVYQDEDGSEIGKQVISGKTDEKVKVTSDVPDGYVVKGEIPTEVTIKPDDTPITVTVEHGKSHVTPDKPVNKGDLIPGTKDKHYPEGLTHNDLNKTVTREITITDPTGKKSTTTQTVTFTRGATVDEVTNKVTYDDWSENGKHTFDKVDVPTVPGYTASQNEVPATEVTSDTTDQTIDISYTANSQTIHIKYVDDDKAGKIIHATTVTGKTGEAVSLNLTVPDKYQLANGQQLPTTYTFTAGSGDVTIDLTHKVVQREATIDAQIELMTTVYSGNDDDDEYLAITVTQNQWTQLDNKIKDSKNVNSDKLYPLVKVGTLTGHVNYDLVDNKVVSFTDDWTSLNLGGQTYQMPDGTEVVNGMFIKNDLTWGKTLKEELLKYHPDVDPDYVNRPWHGYLSVNKTNMIASDFTSDNLQAGLVGNESNALAKAIGDQAATVVKIANETIGSNWLNIHFNKWRFSEQNGQLRADGFVPVVGVYIPYVEKTTTRTINITTPSGKTTTVKQTATLAKQVDLSKDAHPNWTTDEWTSYDVPVIPGYTASQSNVAKEAVTGTTKDQTVNITYTANDGTQTIVYQDEDGSEVGKQVVPGKTDETVKVTPDVPDGYVLKDEVPSEVTIKPDDTPITVTVEHGKSHVTPDKPVNKGDLIPDTKDKHYPEGLTHNDLNKTVTREVTITDPTGKKSTTTQTVTFTRGAIVDEVTNKVTYDNWSENGKHTFDKVNVLTVPGYTVSGDVPSLTVTPDSQSINVTVTYNANEQTATITYIDDTEKKTLGSDSQDGKFNQVITFEHDPAEIINGLKEKGYKLVSNDFNSNKYQADNRKNVFYVHLKHGTHVISDNDSITETITYKMSDGSKAPDKVEKQVEFSRDGYNDEVTKQDHWNKWQPNKQSFSAVPTPEVKGYIPDIKSVEAKTVTAGDKNITITITYTPNKQKAKVVFIDDTTKKILDTHDLIGVTNGHERYNPSEEIEKFIHDNYVFVSSDYPEKGFTYDNNDDEDQVFEVHLKERPSESNIPIVPDNTEDNGGSNDTSTDSDEPEKDNSGSDTVGKSSHKTSVKHNSNKKHYGTKKGNIQKNANKNHQSTKKTNNQKTSKTTELNPNEVNTKTNKPTQTKLGKVQGSTNNTLPQTGNKQSDLMATLGLVISSLGMIGAVKSKKRKDNQ